MKTSLAALLVVIMGLFVSCKQASEPTPKLSDAVESVPRLSEIPGTDSASITLNRNRISSQFTLTLENISDNGIIGNGVYDAWCARWDAPINSNGGQYNNIKLLSSKHVPEWNPVNYLMNNIEIYMDTYDELGWREVQLVLWELLDYQDFDLESDRTFYSDGIPQFDMDLVKTLIADIETNSEGYTHKQGNLFVIFIDMSGYENTQNLLIATLDPDEPGGAFGATYKNGNSVTVKIADNMNSYKSNINADRTVSFKYTPGAPQSTHHSIAADFNTSNSSISAGSSMIHGDLPGVENLQNIIIVLRSRNGTDMTFSGIKINGRNHTDIHSNGNIQKTRAIHDADIQNGVEITGELNYDGPFSGYLQILLTD